MRSEILRSPLIAHKALQLLPSRMHVTSSAANMLSIFASATRAMLQREPNSKLHNNTTNKNMTKPFDTAAFIKPSQSVRFP